MTNAIFQIIFAIAFIFLACFITYKVTAYLAFKIIDLIFESKRFRRATCIVLALLFAAVGAMQLSDFLDKTPRPLARFFPLSFFCAALFLVLLVLDIRRKN